MVTLWPRAQCPLAGLNPFFYRSSVGQPWLLKPQTAPRLNPFFYRSSVGPRSPTALPESVHVLIPSFTGLRLVRIAYLLAAYLEVLIPSFTGLRLVNHQIKLGNARRVLIPSFTGLRLVPILLLKSILWSLNPFFYRSSVGRR